MKAARGARAAAAAAQPQRSVKTGPFTQGDVPTLAGHKRGRGNVDGTAESGLAAPSSAGVGAAAPSSAAMASAPAAPAVPGVVRPPMAMSAASAFATETMAKVRLGEPLPRGGLARLSTLARAGPTLVPSNGPASAALSAKNAIIGIGPVRTSAPEPRQSDHDGLAADDDVDVSHLFV